MGTLLGGVAGDLTNDIVCMRKTMICLLNGLHHTEDDRRMVQFFVL
jgi:hypothetical protein